MGLLVEGKWVDQWYETKKSKGRFVRGSSLFRNHIGPEGDFPAAAGRYHLYVSLACPWAHRTLIFRKLKGLEDLIGVTVVDALMLENGWTLSDDPVNHLQFLHQLYCKANADYTGRVTVPVLWDTQRETIVNNESSEIIRMFNSAFDAWGAPSVDYYPEPLREEIDAVNARVYDTVNNGVYRCGFATTQEAYEEAARQLFESLDWLEARLEKSPWLVGKQITEADWRLFTTLIRFDAVYHGHFKCNLRRIADYPRLSAYQRLLYEVPGVAETVDLEHIKKHYYGSHASINPTGIVPIGPENPIYPRPGAARG